MEAFVFFIGNNKLHSFVIQPVQIFRKFALNPKPESHEIMNYAVFTGTDMMVATVYTSKLRHKEHTNPEQGDEGYLLRIDDTLVYDKETEVFHPKKVNPRSSPIVAEWISRTKIENSHP